MSIFKTVRSWFVSPLRVIDAKQPTASQEGIQARAIRHLIAHGTITARDVLNMGTNDTGKMFTRMRRLVSANFCAPFAADCSGA